MTQHSDNVVPPELPRLRVHHFLAVTAIIAGLLTIAQLSFASDMQIMQKFVQSSMGVLGAITLGISLTLVGFGFAWRRDGIRFFHEPGHWLLLMYLAIQGSFYLMLTVAIAANLMGIRDPRLAMALIYCLAYYLAAVLINAFASHAMRRFVAWRLFFAFHAVMFLIGLIYWAHNRPERYIVSLSHWTVTGVLILLSLAVLVDWRRGRSRDWVHWVGVLVTYVNVLIVAIQMAWYWAFGSWIGGN